MIKQSIQINMLWNKKATLAVLKMYNPIITGKVMTFLGIGHHKHTKPKKVSSV